MKEKKFIKIILYQGKRKFKGKNNRFQKYLCIIILN